MSDTPRTDLKAMDGWSYDAVCVDADFARQLETELRAYQASAEKVLAAHSNVRLYAVDTGDLDSMSNAVAALKTAHTQARPRAEGSDHK
jgi:hypothetical protein